MKRLITILALALLVMATPVSAGIVEDIISVITGESNDTTPPTNISDPSSTDGFSITESGITGNTFAVSYRTDFKYGHDETLELYCPDSMGYIMPVWGATVVGQEGSYKFTKEDAMVSNGTGCYFGIKRGGDTL